MAPSWKITDWTRPSEQVLWWEADESGDSAAAWNDGSSKPNENQLPFRHGSGASIACFDGHVEWRDAIDYLLEAGSIGPNRLWCDPHSPTGGSAERTGGRRFELARLMRETRQYPRRSSQ